MAKKVKTNSSLVGFALAGFLLLAVLFGMQIMTFIFGSLGSVDNFPDVTQTVINETGAYINATGYTLSQASESNFTGGAVITIVYNASDDVVISSGNYTVGSSTGIVTNATATNWANVTISYTSSHKPDAQVTSEQINNNSLNAILNYSAQSGTQFTTLGIAITLVILVLVFAFFWKAFMGSKTIGDTAGGSFG